MYTRRFGRSKAENMADARRAMAMQQARKMTETSLYMYDSCGFFNICGDADLMSTVIEDDGFMAWLNWYENNNENVFVKTLAWRGPEGTIAGGESLTNGAISDHCADPEEWEFGTCEILLEKGLYGRQGDPISLARVGERYCEQQPVYTLDGKPIENDLEWQVLGAGMVLKEDISRHLVTGSGASGQMTGLESLIVTGYTDVRTGADCTTMDSIVYNWGNTAIGSTVNGFTIKQVLSAIIHRLRYKAKGLGGIGVGDMVIMLPTYLRNCLVETWACVTNCDGSVSDGVTVSIDAFRAQEKKDAWLDGGAFGDGFIPVDGLPVSFLVNDWIPIASSGAGYSSDIYVLTRRLGAREVLYGMYQNLEMGASAFTQEAGYSQYRAIDGGKFLTMTAIDNLCVQTKVWTRPGVYLAAPWAQAVINNVMCSDALEPISTDAFSSYFYEEDPTAPVCLGDEA